MKPFLLKSTLLTSALFLATTNAQLLPFLQPSKPKPPSNELLQQPPMGPGIQLPPSPNKDTPSPSNPNNKKPPSDAIILSDVLGTQPQIQIFAGLSRDISSIATRLDDAGKNTTVLAPLNKAITALPRKPWEDPKEYARFGARAYEGSEGEDRAHRNMRRFVEAHIVPVSPWEEGEKVERVGGGEVWWEKKDGKVFVQPGGVEVEGVVSRVANGEVWVLKDVMNYES